MFLECIGDCFGDGLSQKDGVENITYQKGHKLG